MKTFLVLASLLAISMAQSVITNEMVDLHNRDRAKHCRSGNLRPNSTIVEAAQACAKLNADRGYIEHDCPEQEGYGENLAEGSSLTAASAYKMWYDEHKDYKYKPGGFSMETGHFTQVVWKGTKQIGCAIAIGETTVISCLYFPPGNYEGEYQTNVLDPKRCRSSG